MRPDPCELKKENLHSQISPVKDGHAQSGSEDDRKSVDSEGTEKGDKDKQLDVLSDKKSDKAAEAKVLKSKERLGEEMDGQSNKDEPGSPEK